ncbi:hypothetical protein OK006_11006 [Actinobacteria bacterium OK006]|nr:hypothetical protein OK006_11006 [Actinobacteria bacterium OK006]
MKYYFYTWRDDGIDQTIHDLLRWQVREIGRRTRAWWCSTPRACTRRPECPLSRRGAMRQKKYRAASAAWPLTFGAGIAVVVAAASAHENAVGIALLDKVAADTDTVQKALVDQGFKNAVVAPGQKVGIEVEVVERNPAQTGFVPQAKRSWNVPMGS